MKLIASVLLVFLSGGAQAFTVGSMSRTSNNVLNTCSKLSAADSDYIATAVEEEAVDPFLSSDEEAKASNDTPNPENEDDILVNNDEQIIKLPTPSNEDDITAFNELKQIAIAANPVVRYFDPLNLVDAEIGQWSRSKSDTIGWLRHAEIKHGRVAMAAFVGYCVQAQGIRFPFTQDLWPSVAGPEAQWDALDVNLKLSIILFVGSLELADEADSKGHYMRGNKEPGRHPIFQLPTKKSDEDLTKGRVKEINNGRLAMLGIMGFVSSSSVPGSVPFLNNIDVPVYEDNFWAPFSADFVLGTQPTSPIVAKAIESAATVVSAAAVEAVETVTETVAEVATQAASSATTIPSEFALIH